MTSLLWTLIAIQIVMGVFDTFYHHELSERLAWRPSQRYELQLHSLRNMLYAFLFWCSAGWKCTASSQCSSSRYWWRRSSSR
jgi:hypothetical protein